MKRRATIFTNRAIDDAYTWLCRTRKHFPPNADIWHLRYYWQAERKKLLKLLRSGCYYFEPVKRCQTRDGSTIHLWGARDALVLKVLSMVLARPLGISSHCTHVKNHGGLKATVVDVNHHLPHYQFALKTDVADYYASIDHEILLAQLSHQIKDRFLMNLLSQYLKRSVDCGGVYRDIRQGLSRGCALSPLLGAFYLQSLDDALGNSGLYYVRYMDDILVLAPTRWKLKRAVKTLQSVFELLKVTMRPGKTFIGRIQKGFDFLGYRFSHQPLRLATKTVQRFGARLHRLLEQQQTAPKGAAVLGDYVTRWLRWTQAGLGYGKTNPAAAGFDLNATMLTGL